MGKLEEAWKAHERGSAAQGAAVIRLALESVSLSFDDEFLRRRPSQLSLGQGQRVCIAMATLHRPALLLAEEATSALDPITQSEILNLLTGLNRGMGTAILYISHDLLSVAALCHRILHSPRGADRRVRHAAKLISFAATCIYAPTGRTAAEPAGAWRLQRD